MEYSIRPIGYVEKNDTGIYLVINSEIWDATLHVDLFSHLIVLWWIHERDSEEDRTTLISYPPRNKGDEASGAFSCRSPSRPNPIGHTIVKLLEVDDKHSRLKIDHMDANHGSPIIDIKPYLPSSDTVDNARVAPWFKDLERRYTT
ncbi:MAG: tRNA (N6-threonylcarbamoyladenosine(37)-N6)-methyltransferase TrmO [Candidatus Thorarchaeota archaeon]|nr:tRNA (N6-threonylcarbamoyladenosine(37)-N6)-methyltransferase TrmO [Candidatus Thorarchaeota archaeon]